MVDRRGFFGSSLATSMALAARAQAQPKARPAASRPEIYELRRYELRIGPQQKIVNDFLAEVFIPTLNKLGVAAVGAFETTFGGPSPSVTLLVPYESFAAYGAVQDKLAAAFAGASSAAAKAYLAATSDSPAYVRMESTLLQAFDSFPKLERPGGTAARRPPRVFELRTYESPSEATSAKKMSMFTPAMGELEIFRRVGLTPVFFARALIGPRLPSFTYMLTFPDLAAREAAWKAFVADPAWLKLRATPGFGDAEIMSGIVDHVLRPVAYSQV